MLRRLSLLALSLVAVTLGCKRTTAVSALLEDEATSVTTTTAPGSGEPAEDLPTFPRPAGAEAAVCVECSCGGGDEAPGTEEPGDGSRETGLRLNDAEDISWAGEELIARMVGRVGGSTAERLVRGAFGIVQTAVARSHVMTLDSILTQWEWLAVDPRGRVPAYDMPPRHLVTQQNLRRAIESVANDFVTVMQTATTPRIACIRLTALVNGILNAGGSRAPYLVEPVRPAQAPQIHNRAALLVLPLVVDGIEWPQPPTAGQFDHTIERHQIRCRFANGHNRILTHAWAYGDGDTNVRFQYEVERGSFIQPQRPNSPIVTLSLEDVRARLGGRARPLLFMEGDISKAQWIDLIMNVVTPRMTSDSWRTTRCE